MLLVVDVGNTNTVLGVYEGDALKAHWRVETKKGRTSDEYAIILRQLYELSGLSWPSVNAGIVSSVVPPVLFPIEDFFKRHLGVTPLVVGPGIKTGMPILYENPREVGADRIVNAVAAYEQYKQGCVVVDFGTATTFDAVTQRGEYLGGAIVPGIQISADALYHAAAKLPRVELVRPAKVIGRNTVARCRPAWSSATPAWSTPSSSACAPSATTRAAAWPPAGSRRSSPRSRRPSRPPTRC
jgi:type III pantothenate kinase